MRAAWNQCDDPFDAEINDTIVRVVLCEKCYRDRADEI